MIRSYTTPPTSSGDAVRLPAQPSSYRLLALSTEYFPAGAIPVSPCLQIIYGGVSTVARIPGHELVAPAQLLLTYAVGVQGSVTPTVAGITAAHPVPDIIITPQMEVVLTWTDADPADTCGEVAWLLDDEP